MKLAKHSALLPAIFVAAIAPALGANITIEGAAVTLPATSASSSWQTVNFSGSYNTAPVVIPVATTEGADPTAVRIRNVTTSSFEIAMFEAPNSDGPHGVAMGTAWLAIEPTGDKFAVLPGGQKIKAGHLVTPNTVQKGGPEIWTSIPLGSDLATVGVLAHIQTSTNETSTSPGITSSPFLATAMRNVSTSGFDIALERAETGGLGTVSSSESIGWVALETGTGLLTDGAGTIAYAIANGSGIDGWGNNGNDGSNANGDAVSFGTTFASAPLVVASQTSRAGADGGWLRRGSITTTNVNLTVDEDTALDTERNHAAETATVFAFESNFVASFEAVPEPSAASVLALLGLALLGRRRR